MIKNLGYPVRFMGFKEINNVGCAHLGETVKLGQFDRSEMGKLLFSRYEPEIFNGLTHFLLKLTIGRFF